MIDRPHTTYFRRSHLAIAIGSALFAVLVTLGALFWTGLLAFPQPVPDPDRQATVHDMGSGVMPFDLGATLHVFEMTESGGIQQVIANDPDDSAQIALIQQHIQHESMLFGAGNFSDPMTLHGDDMPGVKELTAGAAQVQVTYAAIPTGAQITFATQDLPLITAIHRWFGAQLSDHGVDATYR